MLPRRMKKIQICMVNDDPGGGSHDPICAVVCVFVDAGGENILLSEVT
jgi:hypothetical protein